MVINNLFTESMKSIIDWPDLVKMKCNSIVHFIPLLIRFWS